MYTLYPNWQLQACRSVALEQNQKLFDEANALVCKTFDILDDPDLDSQMFLQYLQNRRKAEAMFRDALSHLALLNEQFPAISKSRKKSVIAEVG